MLVAFNLLISPHICHVFPWQESIEMHLQEKTNMADLVCCLQDLQVIQIFILFFNCPIL